MLDVIIPLGALRTADPRLEHYAVAGDDDVGHLSVYFAQQPTDAVAAVRDYQPLPGAPSANAVAGLPESVNDLDCAVLGAVAHALGTLRRSGHDAAREHLFAATAIKLKTRLHDVREDQP